MSFNKIIIVGNLGKDPELRYTPQGTAVCDFSLATNEKKKDKAGDMQNITTWFRVTLWGKQGETASKYLSKGSPVYIEGRLRIENYTDRDGKDRFSLEVHGTDMQFISAGRSDDNQSNGFSQENNFDESSDFSGGSPAAAPVSQAAPGDDDIPF